MRSTLLLLAFLCFASFASAQDDAATQAMQAAQAAQQAAIQNMQDMQRSAEEANEQAMREMQQGSADTSQDTGPVVAMTATPKISVKSGKYPGPITVKLSDKSRGAVMYYRTDGWTPTTRSRRYGGPFTISQSATLQVIAVAPYSYRSLVASATYTLPSSPHSAANTSASSSALDQPHDNVVPVHFVFAQEVTSAKAEIGDKIPLTLAADLIFNGATLARKGAPAFVSIMQVDKTGAVERPANCTSASTLCKPALACSNYTAPLLSKARPSLPMQPRWFRYLAYSLSCITAKTQPSSQVRLSLPISTLLRWWLPMYLEVTSIP
jgi:hypothetical protein